MYSLGYTQDEHRFLCASAQKNPQNCGFLRWYLQESNQGHTDFQSVALPTELRYLLTKAGANIISNLRYTNKKFKKGALKYANRLFS